MPIASTQLWQKKMPRLLSSFLSNGFGWRGGRWWGRRGGSHSLLRSLLPCHKTNMLGATPRVRVNINTPAVGPGGQPGVSSLWWRQGMEIILLL